MQVDKKIELLWTPNRSSVSEFTKEKWILNRSVAFHGFQPYSLDQEINWEADPFDNITWCLWLHSLIWLYTLADLYEDTRDHIYYDQIKKITLDWFAKYQNPKNVDGTKDRSWHDHSVAYRSATLNYLYLKLFTSDNEWVVAYKASIKIHAELLHSYLFMSRFFGNNHGVFHCFALMSVVYACDTNDCPSYYKQDAAERLISLLHEMIDFEEGVTKEQALEYQYIAIELVAEVLIKKSLFDILDVSFPYSKLYECIVKMISFAFLLRWPDGSIPAIGDTWLKWNGWSVSTAKILQRFINLFDCQKSVRDQLDKLLKNTNVSIDLISFPKNGYILSHDKINNNSLVFKSGPAQHSHGHLDHGSFQYFIKNVLLLVDSGGPYKYGDPLKNYFVSSRAHNLLDIKGLGDSIKFIEFSRSDLRADYSRIFFKRNYNNDIAYIRNILMVPSLSLLLVVDAIRFNGFNLSSESINVESYLHIDKDFLVSEVEDNSVLNNDLSKIFSCVNNKASVQIKSYTNIHQSSEIISGQMSPVVQGWVTERVGIMIPAPVIKLTSDVLINNYLSCSFIYEEHSCPNLSANLSFDADFFYLKFNINKNNYSLNFDDSGSFDFII
jgi:hypothetical protein